MAHFVVFPQTAKAQSKIKTIPWDSAAYLKSDKYRPLFGSCVRRRRPSPGCCRFRRYCRAKGMAQIAEARVLVGRASTKRFRPRVIKFATVLKVMRALGLKLKVAV